MLRFDLHAVVVKLVVLQHPRTISCLRYVADVMYESGNLSVSVTPLLALHILIISNTVAVVYLTPATGGADCVF